MKATTLFVALLISLSCFSQTIPSWFQGEWAGTIVQNFPTGEREAYSVLIEHKKDHFRITSESFYYKCIGKWIIESSSDKEIIFVQVITKNSDKGNCAVDAKIRVYAEGGKVHYYSKGDIIGECKGLLTKNKRSTAEF